MHPIFFRCIFAAPPQEDDPDPDDKVRDHFHVTILANGGLTRGKDICWFSASTKSHDEQRFPDPSSRARSQSSHPPAVTNTKIQKYRSTKIQIHKYARTNTPEPRPPAHLSAVGKRQSCIHETGNPESFHLHFRKSSFGLPSPPGLPAQVLPNEIPGSRTRP